MFLFERVFSHRASDLSHCCSIRWLQTEVLKKTKYIQQTMISNNDLFCVLLKTRLLLYFYISVVCGGLFKKVKLVNKYTVTESVWRLKWNPHREAGLQVFCCNLLFNQSRKLEKGFQIHLKTSFSLCETATAKIGMDNKHPQKASQWV